MQEIHNLLNNEHLNRFAGLFAIAMAPGWRMRHPEVASVRGRLDRLARIIRGGESFDVAVLNTEFVSLVTDIVHADSRLSYASADLDWFYTILADGRQARLALTMLFVTACSRPRWYTCEQLAELTGLSAISWRKRAEHPEHFWMAQLRGKTWLFNEFILRAHGVDLPRSMQGEEIEEPSSET